MQTQYTTTNKLKNAFRSVALAGMVGLSGLVQTAFADTNKVSEVKTSGNVAYYMAGEAKSGSLTSYAELNHSTSLPHSTKISGFMDLYQDGNGYFGKTSIDKGLADGFGAKLQALHINTPLSQVGVGATYIVPTPGKTFAKLTYLPLFVDNKGEQVDNKQIVGAFACADLTSKVNLSGFAEVNVAAKDGPQFAYGEIELGIKIGERLTVGPNIQLNGKGAGKMIPEVVPRFAIRGTF